VKTTACYECGRPGLKIQRNGLTEKHDDLDTDTHAFRFGFAAAVIATMTDATSRTNANAATVQHLAPMRRLIREGHRDSAGAPVLGLPRVPAHERLPVGMGFGPTCDGLQVPELRQGE
jgi:hypothetical protein